METLVGSDQNHKDIAMVKAGAWHSELHSLALYCQMYILHGLKQAT